MNTSKGNSRIVRIQMDPYRHECPRCGNLTHDPVFNFCLNCGPIANYCPHCSGAGGHWADCEWHECPHCEGTGDRPK